MGEPIRFPDRLGLRSSREQYAMLKGMTSRQLLAAVVTKYPGCTFTADELRAAQRMTVIVQPVASNEWVIVPKPALPTEDH